MHTDGASVLKGFFKKKKKIDYRKMDNTNDLLNSVCAAISNVAHTVLSKFSFLKKNQIK